MINLPFLISLIPIKHIANHKTYFQLIFIIFGILGWRFIVHNKYIKWLIVFFIVHIAFIALTKNIADVNYYKVLQIIFYISGSFYIAQKASLKDLFKTISFLEILTLLLFIHEFFFMPAYFQASKLFPHFIRLNLIVGEPNFSAFLLLVIFMIHILEKEYKRAIFPFVMIYFFSG
ncbi:MAG: hypothetical protein Q7U04_07340, partial [Bacteriovorax sp.]|nr:hypothetical protein [Bacteriovorax sp.]